MKFITKLRTKFITIIDLEDFVIVPKLVRMQVRIDEYSATYEKKIEEQGVRIRKREFRSTSHELVSVRAVTVGIKTNPVTVGLCRSRATKKSKLLIVRPFRTRGAGEVTYSAFYARLSCASAAITNIRNGMEWNGIESNREMEKH